MSQGELSAIGTAVQVNVALTKTSMVKQAQDFSGILKMADDNLKAMERSVNPNVGSKIDVKV